MQRLLLILVLSVPAACGQRAPGGVDWFAYTSGLRATGFMRTERAPADAPFDAETIAQGFELTVFNPEADPFGTGEVLKSANKRKFLRKWLQPIVYEIFGDSTGSDRLDGKIKTMMSRLQRATGLEITAGKAAEDRNPGDPPANFLIIYGSDLLFSQLEDPVFGELLSDAQGGGEEFEWIADTIRQWRPAPSPCSGTLLVANESVAGHRTGEIIIAITLLRREVPEALLDTCIEEELAQALGPLGDNTSLRPSIFNDDGEFALLTAHDEAILSILYDPRLTPGMPPEVAMPLVRRIIRERGFGS